LGLTIREYDDPDRARTYDKRPGTTRAEFRALRRLLPPLREGAVVLDVPCGNGRLAPFAAELGPARLLGIDGAAAMARAGADRYDGVAAGDASRLPLPSGSVDLVLSVRLLHHFPERGDRLRILREFARVGRDLVVVSFYRLGTVEGLRRRLKRSARIGLGLGAVREELRAAGIQPLRSASLTPLLREQTFISGRVAAGIL